MSRSKVAEALKETPQGGRMLSPPAPGALALGAAQRRKAQGAIRSVDVLNSTFGAPWLYGNGDKGRTMYTTGMSFCLWCSIVLTSVYT
jgi:hypothetical protein